MAHDESQSERNELIAESEPLWEIDASSGRRANATTNSATTEPAQMLRQLREFAAQRLTEQERVGNAKQSLRAAINEIDRVLSYVNNPDHPRGDLDSQIVRIMVLFGEAGMLEK